MCGNCTYMTVREPTNMRDSKIERKKIRCMNILN